MKEKVEKSEPILQMNSMARKCLNSELACSRKKASQKSVSKKDMRDEKTEP